MLRMGFLRKSEISMASLKWMLKTGEWFWLAVRIETVGLLLG
jgi:hypothetical protein